MGRTENSAVRTVIKWSDEERTVLERAADSSGLTVASFVRAASIRSARKVLAEAPTLESLYRWIKAGDTPTAPPAAPSDETER